mgnify:CR=1 FL=1
MFIDTHCHLTDNFRAGDIDAVLSRARDTGVGTIICPTADPADIPTALEISQKYDNIFNTIGIHPEYAGTDINPVDHITDAILQNPRVVGIGEIGLDYHYGCDNRDAQIKLFESQLEIATRAGLPVAIHTRDADDDTAAILSHANVRGVMHCYTSSWELARKMLDRGFYFSASGILTFKNADAIRDIFAKIPNDRIVIETDSPYCAPVPHRGTTCEPAFVADTARVLATVKGLQLTELADILLDNTQKLYPKCHVN